MPFPSNPSVLFSAGIAAHIGWRVYRRVRRMVGRQKLSNIRPWITVSLYPALIALLLLGSIPHPSSALALMAGAGLGAGLGVLGLRLTNVPDSRTGELVDLSGALDIKIVDGKHFYTFDYVLPGKE